MKKTFTGSCSGSKSCGRHSALFQDSLGRPLYKIRTFLCPVFSYVSWPLPSMEDERARNYSKSQSLYRRGELGIFLRPKASLERESSEFFQIPELIQRGAEFFQGPKPLQKGKARNFSKSQSLYRGGELGIFSSPKASLERERSEVPELIWGWNFFKSHSLYRGG